MRIPNNLKKIMKVEEAIVLQINQAKADPIKRFSLKNHKK